MSIYLSNFNFESWIKSSIQDQTSFKEFHELVDFHLPKWSNTSTSAKEPTIQHFQNLNQHALKNSFVFNNEQLPILKELTDLTDRSIKHLNTLKSISPFIVDLKSRERRELHVCLKNLSDEVKQAKNALNNFVLDTVAAQHEALIDCTLDDIERIEDSIELLLSEVNTENDIHDFAYVDIPNNRVRPNEVSPEMMRKVRECLHNSTPSASSISQLKGETIPRCSSSPVLSSNPIPSAPLPPPPPPPPAPGAKLALSEEEKLAKHLENEQRRLAKEQSLRLNPAEFFVSTQLPPKERLNELKIEINCAQNHLANLRSLPASPQLSALIANEETKLSSLQDEANGKTSYLKHNNPKFIEQLQKLTTDELKMVVGLFYNENTKQTKTTETALQFARDEANASLKTICQGYALTWNEFFATSNGIYSEFTLLLYDRLTGKKPSPEYQPRAINAKKQKENSVPASFIPDQNMVLSGLSKLKKTSQAPAPKKENEPEGFTIILKKSKHDSLEKSSQRLKDDYFAKKANQLTFNVLRKRSIINDEKEQLANELALNPSPERAKEIIGAQEELTARERLIDEATAYLCGNNKELYNAFLERWNNKAEAKLAKSLTS